MTLGEIKILQRCHKKNFFLFLHNWATTNRKMYPAFRQGGKKMHTMTVYRSAIPAEPGRSKCRIATYLQQSSSYCLDLFHNILCGGLNLQLWKSQRS